MTSEMQVMLAAGTPDRRRWLALALLCLVQFMVVLDIAIVNVALPSIQVDLAFSQEDLQWVISAYALVFGGFAGVALVIAIVGVAGVLAFSVSARTREFGIRLAIGSAPIHLLSRVVADGAVIAVSGVVVGAIAGGVLARVAATYVQDLRLPDVLPTIVAATLLVAAAVLASLTPAVRAARVDVVRALRAE